MTNARKDEIKGESKDIRGRLKRQAGEWSGDKSQQLEGAVDQVEGKTQKAAGRVKAKAQQMKDDPKDDSKSDMKGNMRPKRAA